MSRPAELSRLLTRLDPLRLLRRQAQDGDCLLAVCGMDGRPLHAPDALSRIRVEPDGERPSVRRASGPAAAAAVLVFGEPVGYVAAVALTETAAPPVGLTDQAATVLGALCAREYELNDLSREILAAYEELNLFYDLSAELAGAPDVDAICSAVLAKACRVIPARLGWILLSQDEGRSFRVVATHGLADAPKAIPADPSLAAMVAHTRTPGLVDDVEAVDAGTRGVLEHRAVKSLVSVPLCVPGNDERPALGVIQLADRVPLAAKATDETAYEGFTSGDLKLAQALGSQAAILVENTRLVAYEREMGIARTIQQNLLPEDPPQVPGFDVAGACEVASNVGGDYYDHVLVGDHHLGLLLADVSGHNLAAALMQTAVRSTFRVAMLSDPTPMGVLERTNEVLYDDLSRSDLFLTAWLGFVDVRTRELIYGDAGHHPSLLFRRATGQVEKLSAGGVPVGVLVDGLYEQGSVTLAPGDVLVVYTDGLTEARAGGPGRKPGEGLGEEYGEERLISALRDVTHCSARQIVEHLLGAVALFSGGLDAGDDRTLLALKVIERDSR